MFTLNSSSTERTDCVSNPSSSNEINNILLVGNGFDLAVGLKTSYSDFVKYVSIKFYLSKVNDHLKKYDKYLDWIKKCLNDKENELGIKDSVYVKHIIGQLSNLDKEFSYFDYNTKSNYLINQPFFKDFFSLILGEDLFSILCTSYPFLQLKRSDILKFNDNYSEIKGIFEGVVEGNSNNLPYLNQKQLFDLEHNLYGFIKVLNDRIDRSNIKQWLDVESYIELLITNDRDLSVRFYPNNSAYVSPLFANPSLYKEYFSGIEDFCNLFKEYLCTVLDSAFVKFPSCIFTSNIKSFENFKDGFEFPYSESLLNRSHGFIEFSKILNINVLINYNYTYTAETYLCLRHLYDIYNHTYHVNGELDYDFHYHLQNGNTVSNHLVFGFSNTKSIDLKASLHAFEKKVLRVIKNTTPLDLDKLTSKPFNLLIYGHSCGIADGDVIGALLKSPRLKIAVVLCYDQESLVSITNNLIEIVEPSRFDELISNANQKVGNESLYFAVRNE
ncbi:MAG: AbiH family protein [Succinivibrio sp.]|nr:AbiH family protein [Succinivibrio sp.]